MNRAVVTLALPVLLAALPTAAFAQRQVLYDTFADAATFELVVGSPDEVSADAAMWLAVTYEEGDADFPEGSELRLLLRGKGGTVTLATDRPVSRHDVVTRRFADLPDLRYVTCYYPLTDSDLTRLLAHDALRVEVGTARSTLRRPAAPRTAATFARAFDALR